MVTKVQRWGNSQGLRLPKHVLERAEISIGDDVEIVSRAGQILVRKPLRRKYELAEMVSRMPRNYEVREESFGKLAGREAW